METLFHATLLFLVGQLAVEPRPTLLSLQLSGASAECCEEEAIWRMLTAIRGGEGDRGASRRKHNYVN
jgi:hypothetical protein